MAKRKAQKDARGEALKSRWHFADDYSDTIAIWLRVQIQLLQASIDKLKAVKAKTGGHELDGQIDYFSAVIGWLSGAYHNGTRSVPLIPYLDALTAVTVTERHTGRWRLDQSSLPGM